MPLAALYGGIAAARMRSRGLDAGIPVICVGNYHVGGAGKTPTTLALTQMLRDLGATPVVLSRGHGGRLRGPVAVDAARHTAADIGDEPLMMAAQTPIVVARDRVAGVPLARSMRADVIVLDDGFQNPSIRKDLSLIVIDARRGVGNGLVFPAGPLRAPLPPQIARTDALIIIGEGDGARGIAAAVTAQGRPVFRARLVPDAADVAALRGRRALAFAGIGDPARFFRTLRSCGIEVAVQRTFDDHHAYTRAEIDRLRMDGARDGLVLVTTQKDRARLLGRAEFADVLEAVMPLAVTLAFDDDAAVRAFVTSRLDQVRMSRFRGAV